MGENVPAPAVQRVWPGQDLAAEDLDIIASGYAVAGAVQEDSRRIGHTGRTPPVDHQHVPEPQGQQLSRVERHGVDGRVVGGAGQSDRAMEPATVGDERQLIVAKVPGPRRVERLAEAQHQGGRLLVEAQPP